MRDKNNVKVSILQKKNTTFRYAFLFVILCSEFHQITKLLNNVGLEIKEANMQFIQNKSVVIIMLPPTKKENYWAELWFQEFNKELDLKKKYTTVPGKI